MSSLHNKCFKVSLHILIIHSSFKYRETVKFFLMKKSVSTFKKKISESLKGVSTIKPVGIDNHYFVFTFWKKNSSVEFVIKAFIYL